MGCGASAAEAAASPEVDRARGTSPKNSSPDEAKNEVEKEGGPSSSSSGAPSPALPKKAVDRVKWRKGDLIGTGANGRVYLGLEEETGAIIAVKEIVFSNAMQDREELEHMQEEIELLRTLSHPNIVTYLGTDVNDDNQTLYIFTEWVPGGSIQALVTKFGRLSEVIVRKYVAQLLVGLAYLHDQQVVHRDIKAANILVDDRGTIKLADFGSSKRIDALATMGNECHSLRGTPYFMAPEVIMQTGHGRKADIWSVGCTILQMVTGQPPWKSLQLGTPAALMFHIANATEPPPMPDTLSPELTSLLRRAFDRNVDRRPSAEELLADPFFAIGGANAEALTNAQRTQAAVNAETAAAAASSSSSSLFFLMAASPTTKGLAASSETLTKEGVQVRLVAGSPRSAKTVAAAPRDEASSPLHLGTSTTTTTRKTAEAAADRSLVKKKSLGRRTFEDATVEARRQPPSSSSEGDLNQLDALSMRDAPPPPLAPAPRPLTKPGGGLIQDEALMMTFITNEAAHQLQGADRHFPGRPLLTARPRGAPPPRTATEKRRARLRAQQHHVSSDADPAVNDANGAITASTRSRKKRGSTDQSSRNDPTNNGKSPLSMDELPSRRKDNTNPSSAHSRQKPSNITTHFAGGTGLSPASSRQIIKDCPSSSSSFYAQGGRSNSMSTWDLGEDAEDTDEVLMRDRPPEDAMMHTTHDDRPIITEAARREQIAQLEKEKQKAREREKRERKNEQFQAELDRFRDEQYRSA